MVEALLLFMGAPASESGPLNLGNPAEFTIRELAELVLRLTCSRSRLEFHPLPTDDPRQRRPDIARATALLGGWTPSTPLEEGLARTIAYFRLVLGLGPARTSTPLARRVAPPGLPATLVEAAAHANAPGTSAATSGPG